LRDLCRRDPEAEALIIKVMGPELGAHGGDRTAEDEGDKEQVRNTNLKQRSDTADYIRARLARDANPMISELSNAGNARFEVRAVDQAGTPWFVRNDVCAALDLGNPSQATSRLEADEKGVVITETLGGAQKLAIVSEAGLYDLISTSRKPFARRFRRWVFHDVLPQIRKTGRYERQPTAADWQGLPPFAKQALLGLDAKLEQVSAGKKVVERKLAEKEREAQAYDRLEADERGRCKIPTRGGSLTEQGVNVLGRPDCRCQHARNLTARRLFKSGNSPPALSNARKTHRSHGDPSSTPSPPPAGCDRTAPSCRNGACQSAPLPACRWKPLC
jgi:prophage antirepressor-like protein